MPISGSLSDRCFRVICCTVHPLPCAPPPPLQSPCLHVGHAPRGAHATPLSTQHWALVPSLSGHLPLLGQRGRRGGGGGHRAGPPMDRVTVDFRLNLQKQRKSGSPPPAPPQFPLERSSCGTQFGELSWNRGNGSFCEPHFRMGSGRRDICVRFGCCAPPLCPFDRLPSPKLEESQVFTKPKKLCTLPSFSVVFVCIVFLCRRRRQRPMAPPPPPANH